MINDEKGEDATDAADATAFYTAVASTKNKNLVAEATLSFAELLLLLLLLQLHAAHGLQQSQNSNPNQKL